MTGCEYYIDLISAGLDNELSDEECSALTEHLNECSECRALRDAFAAVSGALGEELEDAPEALHENVMAEIRRIEIKKKHRRNRTISTIAACAAVVILGGIGITSLSPKANSSLAGTAEMAVAAPAAPAAASFMAADAVMAEESAAESPAEYSLFSAAEDEEDNFFDLRGVDCDEFLDELMAEECEFDGNFDRCVELIATRGGVDEDIIVYFSGDSIYALAPDGKYRISALSVEDFELFVLNYK